MFLVDRPSPLWWLDGLVLTYVLKAAVLPFISWRRERRGRISLPPLSAGWLRDHELESAKRGAE